MLAPPSAGAAARARRTAASPNLHVEVVQTSADLSDALTRLPDLQFTSTAPAAGTPVVGVNDSVHYQSFRGVGAAMTDSSACLIYEQLSSGARDALMRSLFSSGGLHLGFIRVPMGASDYSCNRTPYTYDDLPAGRSDPKLRHFSIAHDLAYIIPALREALAFNPGAFVLANPWSAPAWMKSNDRLDNVHGSGRLLTADYTPLANYFVKFLKAYLREGIAVNAVTPQNEPGNPTAYPGMNLSEAGEAAFVRYHLAPALHAAHLNQLIYGDDYGWGPAGQRFAYGLVRSRASKWLTGMATHCYFGAPTLVGRLHQLNPRLEQIVSECSPGITPYATSELAIASFRNWASTVALWNFALDPQGQPVQPPNAGCPACTGVVTVNEVTHTATRTPDFYELGQVSKFVVPGAVRIATNTFVTYSYPGPGVDVASAGLDDVAFENPDGSEVLLAYDNAPTSATFAVEWHGRSVTETLPAGATVTLRWRP